MPIPDSQRDVAAFLGGLSGAPPIETHISAVFVGPDQVWKLKKAVRLPFLDFSTVEARRHFLCRELELNKPDAPGIYRDVVAIDRGRDGALTITGNACEEPIDWVLRMTPVPAGDFLDHFADSGGLTDALQDALGDSVARYHEARAPRAAWDSAGAFRRAIQGNAESAYAADLPANRIETWQRMIGAALEQNTDFLASRAAAGFVRRCHGDLHLGNLCLWNGAPLPFDALEFDEELATIDVGYDLAFLLMDLDVRVGRAAANRVLNRYLARTGDAGLCRGLPMFLSLRAMVRAHVQKAAGKADAARRYLAAALDYLAPAAAIALAIGGPPGVGKSTMARRLAPAIGRAPGAVVLRSDEIRKRIFGVPPEQRLPPTAYDEATNARVVSQLLKSLEAVAAGGHAAIADATFLDPDHRRAVAAAAGAVEVPFIGIWLTAPEALLEARISRRRNDASDADLAVLQLALARDAGPVEWLVVDATEIETAASRVSRAVTMRQKFSADPPNSE